MADYSIANLRSDVEDSAQKFGFSPTLEARFGKKDLGSERLSVSYQRVAPNRASPFAHRHKEQAEEIYVVVEGAGRVHLDGEAHELEEWDAVRVAGPVVRWFEAGPRAWPFSRSARSARRTTPRSSSPALIRPMPRAVRKPRRRF